MNAKTNRPLLTWLIILATLSGASACQLPRQATAPFLPLPATVASTAALPATVAPTRASPPTATATPTPTAASVPVQMITLQKGDFYFSVYGRQSFLFSRNVAGNETSHYFQLLDWTRAGGSKFVRIHLDSFGMG